MQNLVFLKDVALSKELEESTYEAIVSLIFFLSIDICAELVTSDAYLTQFFVMLNQSAAVGETAAPSSLANPPDEPLTTKQARDRITMLRDLCTLARNLSDANRATFYMTMRERGLFEVLQGHISHPDLQVRMSALAILQLVIQFSPQQVRTHLMTQPPHPEYPLFRTLIGRVRGDPEVSVRDLVCDLLRALLDTESLKNALEKDEFLNIFYQDFLPLLVEMLDGESEGKEGAAAKGEGEGEGATPFAVVSVQYLVLEMLTFCARNHGYRLKYMYGRLRSSVHAPHRSLTPARNG